MEEEKRGKEKGRGREDAKGGGRGRGGRKGMRENGMRKPVAVINSACFLYLDSSHLSRNLLPLDQVCISLSLVPSRPFPLSLFPSSLHAFSISPHILSSRPVSHFLSFPFLLLLPPTPLPPPPTHQPTPLSFILRHSITYTSIKSFPL